MSVQSSVSRGRVSMLFFIVVAATATSCTIRSDEPSAVLLRTVDYLSRTQAEDGGWHSGTHGILRSGQAWTPFVLQQLLLAREVGVDVPDQTIERGLDFIRQHVNEAGVLGLSDPAILEYPNYSTAAALTAVVLAGDASYNELADVMASYLLAQQFVEDRGIGVEQLAYGSWGFGERTLRFAEVGHVDLSHTRRVAESLRLYRERRAGGDAAVDSFMQAIDRGLARSNAFLGLVQKLPADARVVLGDHPQNRSPFDGGFYSSPVVHGTNKAGTATDASGNAYFVSYATTTADGLLALLAAGADHNDARVVAARSWLRAHPALDRPEGITRGRPGDWDRVMFLYHLASRSLAYEHVGETGSWGQEVAALLADAQQPDGSFSNPEGGPNKEDDPILASALAMESLTAVLRARRMTD